MTIDATYVPKYRLIKDCEKVTRPWRQRDERDVQLYKAVKLDRNLEETWTSQPVFSAAASAGTLLPAENAAQTVGFMTENGQYELRESVVESTGTAAYALPYVSADGLELPLDADLTDGVTARELTCGVTARSKRAFTVGTDPDFFMEAKILIDDISDLGQMFVGFRKAEAYQADPDNYDELAAWHIGETGATVADGQLNIATILNNAATSYTDTTETDWADAATKTLRVVVRKGRQVEFYLNGAAPTVTKVFSFDSGEVVIPFVFVESTAGSTTGDAGVTLQSFRCGWL